MQGPNVAHFLRNLFKHSISRVDLSGAKGKKQRFLAENFKSHHYEIITNILQLRPSHYQLVRHFA